MILRKFCTLFFLALFVMSVGRIWYVSRDGFHINRILYSLPIEPLIDESKEHEIFSILSSSFYYLGRGRQCYVFASQDNRYVLKIPRFDRYTLPFFWQAMPSCFDDKKQSILSGRQDRLTFTLESFRIAAEDLQDETAVIYSHFHQTNSLPTRVVIYDRLSRGFLIDLNQMAFVVQEKKELMMPLIVKALKENDRARAQQMIIAFLDVIDKRAQKGIFNRDPSFLKNFGWDGSKSVQIDIGSFWRKSELSHDEAYRVSLIEGSCRVREWLAETDPELLSLYESELEKRVNRRRS